MKRPEPGTTLVGHPAFAGGTMIAACGAIYLSFQLSGFWPIGLGVLFVAARVLKLADRREKYVRWQREWNSMGSAGEPMSDRPRRKYPVAGIAALALVLLYCAANLDEPICRLALTWTVAVTAIGGVIKWLASRRATGGGKAKTSCVEICIGGPLLAVPSIEQAYRALPDHCQRLLRR